MAARLIFFWLAALSGAGAVLANPEGLVVVHGTAGAVAAGKVLTVTNSPGAIINWQNFAVAPDETTRFVQGSNAGTVLNRVLPGGAFSPLGRVESNGQILFLNGGVVSGAVSADLGALAFAPLRLRGAGTPGFGRRAIEPHAIDDALRAAVASLLDGRVVVLAREPQAVVDDCGELMVMPGATVVLADARWRHLRVQLTAARNEPLNLTRLLARENGMFFAVAANSAVTSRLSDRAGTAIASAPSGTGKSTLFTPPAWALTLLSDIAFIRAPLFETALLPQLDAPFAVVPPAEPIATASIRAVPLEMEVPSEKPAAPDIGVAQAMMVAMADPIELPELPAGPLAIGVAQAMALAFADPLELPVPAQPAPDIGVAQAMMVAMADPVSLPALPAAAPRPVAPVFPAAAHSSSPPHASEPAQSGSGVAEMYADLPLTIREIRGDAPVRLARIEKSVPRMMIDHRGAVFHL